MERTRWNNSGSAAPLFITRFSLSGRTAVGVQTRRFVDGCSGARHLYWEDLQLGDRDSRSIRLERALPARFGMFKRSTTLARAASAFGLSQWRGDDLIPTQRQRIQTLGANATVLYLAPIGGRDAARMLHLVELVDRPFLLHLWDLLDGPPQPRSALARLIERASRVCVLTPEMADALGLKDAERLAFSRDDSAFRAEAPPADKPLRVALIGDISSYRSGLHGIVEADRVTQALGMPVEWIYIGRPGVPRSLDESVAKLLRPTGFIDSNAGRDRALADCHVAFLPGPQAAPELDMRSRFSVPSRLMDFGANALPVAGFVHPRAAAAHFAEESRATLCLADGAELATCLQRLRDPTEWRKSSALSRAFYERITGECSVRRLDEMLAELSRGDSAQ